MNRAIKRKFRRFIIEPNFRFITYLMLIVIIISTVLLSINAAGTTYNYNIGDIAIEDIKSPREIQYINESETEIAKKIAAESVPVVFDKDQAILVESIRRIERLFSYSAKVLTENPPGRSEDRTFQLITLKDILPKDLIFDDRTLWNILKSGSIDNLKRTTIRILIFIFDNGIIEEPFKNPFNIDNQNITIRTINTSDATPEKSSRLEDIKILKDIKKELYAICYSISADKSREQLQAIYDIANRELRPNLQFNPEETKRRIDEKNKTIKPVLGIIKKGQMIVREGDTVTTESLNNIIILNKNTASTNITYPVGILLLQLIITLIAVFFSDDPDYKKLQNKKFPTIIFSLVMIFMIYTFALSRAENIYNTNFIFALLLPIPLVTMTIVTLFNDRLIAMLVSIFIIFFSFIISLASYTTMILAFSSAILGIIVIRNIEKRTEFLRAGFTIGLINSVIIFAIGLMEEYSASTIFKNIQLSFAHGIMNSILVMGIFPIYENLFGVTTRLRLLELSDLNAKIFKRMLMKAPGTYNHSLMVANMAEAACEAIGADPILARVGGYYHDIGKVNNAQYFVENKKDTEDNPDISPEDYTKLIISHVEKGVEIAKENKIPDPIIDFIREHHGTSTMTYFYHQALENAQSSGETDINKKDFQYGGPKPQSRETAVVMIADSVEAASRSIQGPTSIKLEGLVKKIIYNKLNDGELENSNLNISDLKIIQTSINRILKGLFHTRLEYPKDEEVKELEDKVLNSNGES
ncbi:MAG: HDIG domain-containing protein [Spirochaetes bacterium]|nr:HDIG domain-containing protein [Spirochaetota bacterium]